MDGVLQEMNHFKRSVSRNYELRVFAGSFGNHNLSFGSQKLGLNYIVYTLFFNDPLPFLLLNIRDTLNTCIWVKEDNPMSFRTSGLGVFSFMFDDLY